MNPPPRRRAWVSGAVLAGRTSSVSFRYQFRERGLDGINTLKPA